MSDYTCMIMHGQPLLEQCPMVKPGEAEVAKVRNMKSNCKFLGFCLNVDTRTIEK